MSQTNPQPPPDLDAYLDGVLDPAAREAFERAMRADPALAGQVALQRKINQSLGRLFAASAGAVAVRSPTPARRIALRPLYWSIAAAVLLACGLAGYFYISRPTGPGPLPAVYQAQIDNGFVPKVVCTTVPEFADWVNQYFGQRLYPPEKHEGIELIGWNYAAAVSSNSGVLLARVEGKPVVMIVDRKVREKKPLPLPAGPGLRAFKREIGSVVLYEVTPLDHPAILPILSTRPEGGGGG